MGSNGEKPLALGDPLFIVLQSFQFHPFVEVLPGNGRHAKEFRRRDGNIAVDPLGDLDQFLDHGRGFNGAVLVLADRLLQHPGKGF